MKIISYNIEFKKIITAAHCMKSTDPKAWKIRAGHLSRYDRNAQIRKVVRLYKHPRYNSRDNNNDITIMIVRNRSTIIFDLSLNISILI